MTKCCERVITLEEVGELFSDPPILLFKPFPVAAPLSAVEVLLNSARGQDHSKTDELIQEFLRRWCIPPPPSCSDDPSAPDQSGLVARDRLCGALPERTERS